MTEMKDKVYPELPAIRENPSAPPVVNGGADDRGHSYRLNIIQDVQKFLEEEIKKREEFSKKYFRISRIINIVDNGLFTVTLGAEGAGGCFVAYRCWCSFCGSFSNWWSGNRWYILNR